MTEKTKRPYTRTLKVWTVMSADGNERLVRAYTAADALRHVTPQFVIAPATHDDIILVRAYTAADMLRHVTPQFVIAPATHDDIISLMAGGVPVETVGLPEAAPAEESAGLTD